MKHLYSLVIGITLIFVSSCTKNENKNTMISGAKSGIVSIELLQKAVKQEQRNAARLGVFIAEYLSQENTNSSVLGAVNAVSGQGVIIDTQQEIVTEDGRLLSALSSALEVDVADLLNRSPNREQALTSYSESLTNVAKKANDRLKELESALNDLKLILKDKKNDQKSAEQKVKAAMREKDFTNLAEFQKDAADKKLLTLEIESKTQSVAEVASILEAMLKVYAQKIVAIEANREALIAGVQVIDIPGVDELKLIKKSGRNSGGSSLF